MKDCDTTWVTKTGMVTLKKKPSLPQNIILPCLALPEMPSVQELFSLQYSGVPTI